MDPGLEAYFYRTRDLWKEYISRNVPLDLRMLEDNEAYLDWYLVSQNKAVRWTPEIIERFESNWDWMKLTRNRALYRRIKLIEPLIKKYFDRWSWKYLQKRRKFLVTAELLQLNRSRKVRYTDMPALASEIYALRFPESPGRWLEKPKEQWRFMPGCFRYATDWHGGERDGFQALLSQHGELVNWSTLSSFRGLNETLIQEYENQWDWKVMSQNPWLPYSLKLLRIYSPKWSWPIHAAHGSKLKRDLISPLFSNDHWILKKFPEFFKGTNTEFVFKAYSHQLVSTPLTLHVLSEAFNDEETWIMINLLNESDIAWSKELYLAFENEWLVPLMTIPRRVFNIKWTADLVRFLLQQNER